MFVIMCKWRHCVRLGAKMWTLQCHRVKRHVKYFCLQKKQFKILDFLGVKIMVVSRKGTNWSLWKWNTFCLEKRQQYCIAAFLRHSLTFWFYISSCGRLILGTYFEKCLPTQIILVATHVSAKFKPRLLEGSTEQWEVELWVWYWPTQVVSFEEKNVLFLFMVDKM